MASDSEFTVAWLEGALYPEVCASMFFVICKY
jgi:hypothetical protein